jgi:hypothetical protein
MYRPNAEAWAPIRQLPHAFSSFPADLPLVHRYLASPGYKSPRSVVPMAADVILALWRLVPSTTYGTGTHASRSSQRRRTTGRGRRGVQLHAVATFNEPSGRLVANLHHMNGVPVPGAASDDDLSVRQAALQTEATAILVELDLA